MRLKLFQGVLVNKKNRDNYVNKIDQHLSTSGSIVLWKLVGSMSWTRAEGKNGKPISQIRPSLDL